MARQSVDIIGKNITFDCMSCDIVSGKLIPPGGMIYEDDFLTLAADVEVPIKGFIILAPKKHVISFTELSDNEAHHILDVLKKAINALKSLGICQRVNIVQEEKHHMHIWILPIHDWMNETGDSVKDTRKIFEYAKETAKKNGVYDILDTIKLLQEYFKNN